MWYNIPGKVRGWSQAQGPGSASERGRWKPSLHGCVSHSGAAREDRDGLPPLRAA
ncbi:hypothetical protein AALA82_13850 [Oscillospiraceae bacterium 50-16]